MRIFNQEVHAEMKPYKCDQCSFKFQKVYEEIIAVYEEKPHPNVVFVILILHWVHWYPN